MTPTFAPDLAALIPLLASVRARKLARLGGVADQSHAEDEARTPDTAEIDESNAA